MKSSRFKLAEWQCEEDEFVDIPWPTIHEQAGSDHIDWINHQDPAWCQIILEKDPDGDHRLYVEFYHEELAVEYSLLWSK
jgi:hypothetical protein